MLKSSVICSTGSNGLTQFRLLQEADPEELFDILDVDGDGFIGSKEFAEKVRRGVKELQERTWEKFHPDVKAGGKKICLAGGLFCCIQMIHNTSMTKTFVFSGFIEILKNKEVEEFVRVFAKSKDISFVVNLC